MLWHYKICIYPVLPYSGKQWRCQKNCHLFFARLLFWERERPAFFNEVFRFFQILFIILALLHFCEGIFTEEHLAELEAPKITFQAGGNFIKLFCWSWITLWYYPTYDRIQFMSLETQINLCIYMPLWRQNHFKLLSLWRWLLPPPIFLDPVLWSGSSLHLYYLNMSLWCEKIT